MSVVFGRRGPPFWVLDFGLIIFTFQLLTEKGGTNAEADSQSGIKMTCID